MLHFVLAVAAFYGGHRPTSRVNLVCANKDCAWEPVAPELIPRVMARYFGVPTKAHHSCEVFTIGGVPAASMLYTEEENTTVVDEFHLNINMIVLFDASRTMRWQLRERHTLDMRDALHRDEFWAIP